MNWAERVANLRQWTRGGERAPHKPLLLLYALGHFQRHGDEAITFSDAEESLRRLLEEFGPPRATSPAYPFHHLTNDGLWTVTTASGPGSPGTSVRDLRREQAAGRLAGDLVKDLRAEPRLLAQLAHVLLDTNFEASLHEDICQAVGLDVLKAEDEAEVVGPERQRDPRFRRELLVAYEYRCAFCGYDGILDGSMVGLEGAHVRWLTHGGPNQVANGLCLCSIHHKLFDKGVLGISDQQRVKVSALFVGRSEVAEHLVLSLNDRPVNQPLRGYAAVAPEHAEWHTRQVFRGPARAA